jgi:hypothetical protein
MKRWCLQASQSTLSLDSTQKVANARPFGLQVNRLYHRTGERLKPLDQVIDYVVLDPDGMAKARCLDPWQPRRLGGDLTGQIQSTTGWPLRVDTPLETQPQRLPARRRFFCILIVDQLMGPIGLRFTCNRQWSKSQVSARRSLLTHAGSISPGKRNQFGGLIRSSASSSPFTVVQHR